MKIFKPSTDNKDDPPTPHLDYLLIICVYFGNCMISVQNLYSWNDI